MKKARGRKNDSGLKMASGGEDINFNIKLLEDKPPIDGDKTNPGNIIEFPKNLSKTVEFQINDNTETHDDYMRLMFVSRVLEKYDTSQPYKSFLHVEVEDGKRMVIGSDGRRLHAAVVDLDLLPGNYTVRFDKKLIALCGPIENKEAEYDYPNWKKTIPYNPTKKADIDFAETGLKKDRLQLGMMSQKMYSLIKRTGKLINLYYLDDLSKEKWAIYVADDVENSPVIFKREDAKKNMFAIIMPMETE
jgi:hypothetical protein